MGFGLAASTISCMVTRPPQARLIGPKRVYGSASIVSQSTPSAASNQTVVRRSGNYPPNMWNHDYLQSLTSVYTEERHTSSVEKLKGNVRTMLQEVLDPLERLQLVDALERLGVSYHFKDEIAKILKATYSNCTSSHAWKKDNLSATALEFRLLRKHGFQVPQEAFSGFVDEHGKFKAWLCGDIKGMLCLYEASYLSIEGENMLEEAKSFTTKHLKESLKQSTDQHLLEQVRHALELPLHWMMPRVEARWFIDAFEKSHDMNPQLLELAKLDFNMVQATHLEDLKDMTRWWRNTGLAENLSFARDRLVENFLWAVGKKFEPQFEYFRRMATKVNVFITTIDDVFDVYGTIDELELFTNAVQRWDINAIGQLPDYMKMCFLSLYNNVNEMAYDVLKEQGLFILPYLSKMWAELCKAYLREAKWYHSGSTPTLKEYLDNAWLSSSGPLILVHAYFFITKQIQMEALECFQSYPAIFYWSCIVLRLADDLGTSSDELRRGDVPKSIQCHMHETGVSEEEARDHIKFLIEEAWKKMNKERFSIAPFSDTFIDIVLNLPRTAQCIYQHGDGHGILNNETTDREISLFVEPIDLV